jgi:THO complex subunit 2
MLEIVMKWHMDETTFNKECLNYPGFVTKLRVNNQCNEESVSYSNFKLIVHRWHVKMTRAICLCFASKDYIQTRNAFIVLMHIQAHYPVVTRIEIAIRNRVMKIRDEEKNKREDLHVLASSYLGILKQNKGQLVDEEEFIKSDGSTEIPSKSDESLKSGEFVEIFINLILKIFLL